MELGAVDAYVLEGGRRWCRSRPARRHSGRCKKHFGADDIIDTVVPMRVDAKISSTAQLRRRQRTAPRSVGTPKRRNVHMGHRVQGSGEKEEAYDHTLLAMELGGADLWRTRASAGPNRLFPRAGRPGQDRSHAPVIERFDPAGNPQPRRCLRRHLSDGQEPADCCRSSAGQQACKVSSAHLQTARSVGRQS